MVISMFIVIFEKEKIKSVQKVFKKHLQSVQKVLKYSYKMSGEIKNTKNRRGGLGKMYQFNKDLIHVAVDSGKSSTKYAYLGQNGEIFADSIATLFKPVDLNEGFTGSADKIIIGDNAWQIGGMDGDIRFDEENSKLKENHEKLIYTAIARVLTQHLSLDLSKTINVSLSVNVPLEDFKDVNIKSKYVEAYLSKEDEQISLNINGKDVHFKIVKVSPFYESQGAIIRNQQLINKEDNLSRTYVIDCGSKNDTHIVFDNRPAPVQGKNAMGFAGINTSLRQFALKLSGEMNDRFTIVQVENFLAGNNELKGWTKEKLYNSFADIALELAMNIKNTTDALQISKHNTNVLFSGGASIILKEQLKSVYENAGYTVHFSQDARFDNCKGALIKGLKQHG